MSTLEKMNLPETGSSDDALSSRRYESLMQDVSVKKLILQKKIPEEQLKNNLYIFERWRKEVEPCRGCKSLSSCRQKKKGYHMGLAYEGILMETMEACPYERERESRLSHMDNYLIADLGEEYQTVVFQDVRLESNDDKAYYRAVMEICQLYLNNKGAYLYGNMGTGKTWLAACAANQTAMDGGKVAFIHYPSFCDRQARTYFTGESRAEEERCRYADLLVVDDIGAEEVTAKNRMVLLSILDHRMQNHRMTWFTGNGDFTMLQNHLRYDSKGEDTAAADRIIERIRVLAKPVLIDGRDRRNTYK